MNNQRRHQNLFIFTGIYLVLLTVVPLFSGLLPGIPQFVGLLLNFPGYLLMAYLLLAALGSCPLRWRKISPWVFVICLAHTYWIEFVQGIWPGHGTSSYYQMASAAVGALAGIRLRISYTYKRCNCSLSVALQEDVVEANYPPITGYAGIKALITHHPLLPQIIARSFGWKAMSVDSPLGWNLQLICTGKSLVSLPHFSYGALFGKDENTTQQQLSDWLENLHFTRGFDGLEYRRLAKAEEKDVYKVVSWLRLETDMDGQMKGFSSNLRRKISKGYRNGIEIVSGKEELLDAFYRLYMQHMMYLGSGALNKRFFRNLLHDFNTHGGTAEIFLAYQREKIVGAAFNLSYQGFCENGWFVTKKDSQRHYSSYVMHHAMIKLAIEAGNRTYSFGRSSIESGVHNFKKQWGTEELPLTWVQYPHHKVKLRQQTWLLLVWKRIPTPIRKQAGKYLAKWIY